MREAAARLTDECDFIILPTVPRTAFPAELAGFSTHELFAPWLNTFLFNLTEQPASSVPCAVSRGGLPIGLQIVGRRYDDKGVFALSRVVEALVPMYDRLEQVIRNANDGSRTETATKRSYK
jgi:Asp-tRNA(Asn)/Glu-tRNA(Gln) amidotransferase A subunit family amidase